MTWLRVDAISMREVLQRMLVISAIGSVVLPVRATIYTWDGGGFSNNWATAENWSPDGSVPQSASDTTITLNGNVQTTLIHDLENPFVLNRLEFLNDGATKPVIALSGNTLRVVTNGTSHPCFYLTRNATCSMSNPVEIPSETTLKMEFTTYGLTLNGVISGEGGIEKLSNDGGLSLANSGNTFSGGLTVHANDRNWCKVNIDASGAMGTGPVNLYGGTLATTFNNPGGLIFNNTTTHTNTIYLFADSPMLVGMTNDRNTRVTLNGPVALSTNTLHLRGGGFGTINGAISGTGANALKKSDAGTWVLAGENTFTGRVTVAGGVLTVANSAALPLGVPLTVSGGNLNLNGLTVTNSSIVMQGGVLSNGTVYATGTSSLSGGRIDVLLTGPGGVTKSGSETLVLNQITAYDGTTTISGGVLQFAQRTALYGGDTTKWNATNIVVNSGGTLALNVGGNGEFTADDLHVFNAIGSAGGGFLSGSFLGIDTTYAPDGFISCSATIDNANGNMRGLVKLGTGTLELAGLNTFTGPMQLSNGVVSVSVLADGGVASGIGMSSAYRDNLVFAGGTLRYTGPGGVRMSSTGLVVFVAANAYTGATSLDAGTLQLSAAERIADMSPLHLSGGTLKLNGFSETAGPLDVDGASVIDFGSGASTLTLADSSAEVWNGSLVLRNMTAGVDHLVIGSGATLSLTQLARITSPIGQKAKQLANGEVILLPLGTVLHVR